MKKRTRHRQRGVGKRGLTTRINRRVLVFVDEHGTSGQPGFALGCVVIFGRDAGQADKALSDSLTDTAKEIHAAELRRRYVTNILEKFHVSPRRPASMIMMSRAARETGDTPSALYGRTLVEAVSTGLSIFRKRIGLACIRNVHVLIDFHEQHSGSVDFWAIVRDAQRYPGHFRGVSHVAMIDSAASRLLQLPTLSPPPAAGPIGKGSVPGILRVGSVSCPEKEKPPEGGFLRFPYRAFVSAIEGPDPRRACSTRSLTGHCSWSAR